MKELVMVILALIGSLAIGIHLFLLICKAVDWVQNANYKLESLQDKVEFLDKRYYSLQYRSRDCSSKTSPVETYGDSQ